MEDLWPKIEENTEIRPPALILNEQAALLGEKTFNLVLGQVDRLLQTSEMVYFFYLKAPALQNYSFQLFYIKHNVDQFYPLEITTDIFGERKIYDCDNEDAFIHRIKEIFHADRTKNIISSLITQSKI